MLASEKKIYSSKELDQFKKRIEEKMADAQRELDGLTKAIHSLESTTTALSEESSSSVEQREQLNELAARQVKFIYNLQSALGRIEKGTYGICIKTGRLIEKGRLWAVPHTNHSKEAKDNRKTKSD